MAGPAAPPTTKPAPASGRRLLLLATTKSNNQSLLRLCWLLVLISVLSSLWLIVHVHNITATLSSTNMEKEFAMLPPPMEKSDDKMTSRLQGGIPETSNTKAEKPKKADLHPARTSSLMSVIGNSPNASIHMASKHEGPPDKQSATAGIKSSTIQQADHKKRQGASNTTTATATTSAATSSKADILPPMISNVTYLGVLIDSGRHMFSWKWLYDLLETLALLDYNMIHFRLTDDQLFAMELQDDDDDLKLVDKKFYSPEEWKSLETNQSEQVRGSTGSNTNNPNKQPPLFYKQHDLNAWVKYAKSQYNITIIPEVNLPGHAGAWGPEWVVPCPTFACERGYGLPLNVTHPKLPDLLTTILQQVVNVFDQPPYLHLGGDEVWMAHTCLEEVGVADFEGTWYPLIERFEQETLTNIIHKLGYDESQIIRWEHKQPTHMIPTNESRTKHTREGAQRSYYRTGSITQYWQTVPRSNITTGPWFASTGLYMDVLGDGSHGYGDYQSALSLISTHKEIHQVKPKIRQRPPTAIIVGTFELSQEYWMDRNVVGRLLAVRMALAERFPFLRGQEFFDKKYRQTCTALTNFWYKAKGRNEDDDKFADDENIDDRILPPCRALAKPLLSPTAYQFKWQQTWDSWKQRTCQLLSITKGSYKISRARKSPVSIKPLNELYWEEVAENLRNGGGGDNEVTNKRSYHNLIGQDQRLLPKSSTIDRAGILVDLLALDVPPSLQDFQELFRKMKLLGLTWLQLRVANDDGVAIDLKSVGKAGYRLRDAPSTKPNNTTNIGTKKKKKETGLLYEPNEIEEIVHAAKSMGIEIVPEVSLTTNAGGWHNRRMLAQCPQHLCTNGRNVAIDIGDEMVTLCHNDVYPTLLLAVAELKRLFSSSDYFHLGHDERQASQACLEEAGIPNGMDRWDVLERKLSLGAELLGMNRDKIVRWENQEQQRYTSRTGEITQYVSPPFITEDLPSNRTDKKTAYYGRDEIWGHFQLEGLTPREIYSVTRTWSLQVGPQRLVAGPLPIGQEAAKAALSSSSKLVAFALGVSDVEHQNKESFQMRHTKICIQFNNCAPSPTHERDTTTDHPLSSTQEKANIGLTRSELDKGCSERTLDAVRYLSRKHEQDRHQIPKRESPNGEKP